MNILQRPHPLKQMLPGMFFLVASATTSLQAQRITVTDTQAVPVVVESAAINTEVTGRIAVTTFDLVFRNPNNRILEGSFEFPLLDGQKVVGFGLDINGKLREAVPVEKDRGRIVFEEIERRRVDPGLLEQTVGNNYRARIYPLPAHGTRRVVITYQEDLALGGADPVYRLALNFPAPLETFRLAVNVQAGDATLAKTRTTLPLELPAWQDAKRFVVERTAFTARGVFELELPRTAHPQMLTERRGDSEYFYAEVPVATVKPVVRPVPTVVGLLWDASGSGRDRDHEKELALLDAWFASVRDVEVQLTVFRDRAALPLGFKVKNGDWSKLRNELKKMVYDGATSFDGLTDDPTVGEWLMFSDGLVNYGVAQSATTLPLRAPVHTILASPQANPALLRGVAQRQAGEFVNLLTATPVAAARLLRTESMRVLQLEHNPEEISQIFPELNAPVGEELLVVTGILKTPSAKLRLQLGHSAVDAQEIELTVRSGENPSRLAARAWAATKILSLETDLATNREDIRRTSQEFGIVTADTSLIVLETLQDYLRYDIAPPVELRTEWEANRRSTVETQLKNRNMQLDRIARLFEEKKQWWGTKFSKEQQPAPIDTEVAAMRSAPAAQLSVSPPAITEVRGTGEDEVVVLSPFVVEAALDTGYSASSTLAGTRLRTQLHDNAESGNFSARANEESGTASITLRHWEANAGYLDRLHRTSPAKRYSVYLEERSDHARQPGFFLDVAEFFFETKETDLALRILSNLAELQLDDPALLRVLAHRLVQAGHPELARPLFERVLTLRPEEPQSRRDLALVCSSLKQYQRAVDLLWEIVAQPWDARFPEIEVIALGDLNAIVATCGERLDLSRIDTRFLQNLSAGLRVILTWDADACDIDLWVDDPNGEQAIYSHPRTAQGGRMSRDFTGGYGPEEFLLRDPKPGKYKVRIDYFGERSQTALGPVTAQIRLITGFGTPAQNEKLLTVRLSEKKENLEVGEIEIGQ
jgi:tetratricopeptide (TPR) repeat protein